MAGWHVIEKYLEQTGKHSTLIGKYWISMFLILRLMMLMSICDAAFGDVGLECDTKTPGCQKMCENQFYPISPQQYWSIQLLFITLPIMIFMVYTSHKMEKIEIAKKLKKTQIAEQKKVRLEHVKKQKEIYLKDREKLQNKKKTAKLMYERDGMKITRDEVDKLLQEELERIEEAERRVEEEEDNDLKKDEGEVVATKATRGDNSHPPKLFLGYVVMVFVRTVIEAAFIVGYFYIYVWRFVMPETYKCDRRPCNEMVVCYVNRPKQKTIVIMIMFATGCFTVLIGLIELWNLGIGKTVEAFQQRHIDITKEYKISQFQSAQQVHHAPVGFPAVQGVRVDHERSEIDMNDDEERRNFGNEAQFIS